MAITACTRPLPQLVWPTTRPRSWSCTAPVTISEAEADAAVDEHHHGEGIHGGALGGAGLHHVPAVPAPLGDDQLVGPQQLPADAQGRVQHAAAVVAQVQDQGLHALGLEVAHRPLELLGGGLPEVLDGDEAGGGIEHEAVIDAVGGDLAAGDAEAEQAREAHALHGHLHHGALVAPQLLHRGVAGQVLGGLAVDLPDDVAGPEPTFSEGPPRTVLTMTMPSGCCTMIEPMPKKEPRCSSRMDRNSASSM